MQLKRLIVVFVVTVSVSSLAAKPEDEAKKSAEKWLFLVDAGKFAESWKAAGPYLQHACAEDVWEHKLDAMRKPLGKLVSRRLESAKFEKRFFVPDGDYVKLKFDASFENKKQVVETVTPVLQKDGTWKDWCHRLDNLLFVFKR